MNDINKKWLDGNAKNKSLWEIPNTASICQIENNPKFEEFP